MVIKRPSGGYTARDLIYAFNIAKSSTREQTTLTIDCDEAAFIESALKLAIEMAKTIPNPIERTLH